MVKERLRSLRRIRSQIDIMASILSEAIEGARKTRIMYRSNLSYRQLRVYLKLLLDMDMLKRVSQSESGKARLFKVSAKGLEFLDAYRKLKALMA